MNNTPLSLGYQSCSVSFKWSALLGAESLKFSWKLETLLAFQPSKPLCKSEQARIVAVSAKPRAHVEPWTPFRLSQSADHPSKVSGRLGESVLLNFHSFEHNCIYLRESKAEKYIWLLRYKGILGS